MSNILYSHRSRNREPEITGLFDYTDSYDNNRVMLLVPESSLGQAVKVRACASTRIAISNADGDSSVTVVPLHPLGIKPAGNAYTSSTNIRSTIGIFASLPDELVVQVLEYLDSTSLLQLGATCKALYAFSRLEDLWKALFLGYGHFHSSWLYQRLFNSIFRRRCSVFCEILLSCSLHVSFTIVGSGSMFYIYRGVLFTP